MNSLHMMGSCSNKIESSFPPQLTPLYSTSCMLLIMDLNSPFNMPADVCSGQGSTARLQIFVGTVSFVLSTGTNTLANLSNHTLALPYLELNGVAYLVAADHFSDFYEIDCPPSIQSSAVVKATKQHFGCNGILHFVNR